MTTRAAVDGETGKRWRMQISLDLMLLAMVTFGLISAGLLYASRVPAVQQEWATLTGMEAERELDPAAGRTRHLIFILFTFTSPLLLAAGLSTMLAILRWLRASKPLVRREDLG